MTETELLSILSSHGADFTATPRDLESKHGRSAWLDLPSWPIVRVPTTPLFPEHTDSFYVSLAVPLAQLAPGIVRGKIGYHAPQSVEVLPELGFYAQQLPVHGLVEKCPVPACPQPVFRRAAHIWVFGT